MQTIADASGATEAPGEPHALEQSVGTLMALKNIGMSEDRLDHAMETLCLIATPPDV